MRRLGFTRRQFLQATTAGVLTLSLGRLAPTPFLAAEAGTPPMALPDYRGWEDLYRQKWQWDSVSRSTHFVNCWYDGPSVSRARSTRC
jgi:hypothetical protein